MIRISRLLRLCVIAALILLLLWIYAPPFMDTLRDNACMQPVAKKKYVEAFKGCSKRAQEGSLPARLMLGKLYEDGRGTLQDYAKAEENYLAVANARDQLYTVAALSLGDLYKRPDFEKGGPEKSAYWYRQAADNGDKQAQVQYGAMLILGHGVIKNIPLAKTYLEKAALAGDGNAKTLLEQLKNKEKAK